MRTPPPLTPPNTEWPPDYAACLAWREEQLARFALKPALVAAAKAYYRTRPIEFINHWCTTYDPRNQAVGKPTTFPFIMFQRQVEFVQFIEACLAGQANGLIEKSRDIGATWVCCAFSVWLWLFWDGVAIGWGSRKKEQVDHLGNISSIFEKMRALIRNMPKCFQPPRLEENMAYMRLVNISSGATIIGEIGDDIGRGARTLIYFVDEAGHLEHPEAVEASLLATTRTRIDISSVSGQGTIFHRKREAGKDWEVGAAAIIEQTNVFVMDWRDHPEKTEEWYKREKKRTTDYGMEAVFAREVDRDYAASVEGVIIPAEWVRSAIDADQQLNLQRDGGNCAGLDVADGIAATPAKTKKTSATGGDRNALVMRQGIFATSISEWGERDTGATTRRAVAACSSLIPIELQYDCIGVGAGVKAEVNRLSAENFLPKGIRFVPWNAGAKVIDPHGRVIPEDKDSPKNKDFFMNFKAQAWWSLRRRFENTFRAINEVDFTYEPEDLVVIPSSLPDVALRQLIKELSQPTMIKSTSLKMMVDKTPEGTKSPNLADAFVMAFFPVPDSARPRTSIYGPIVVR